MHMVFLTYIYVRYKICIKLHFFTYLISKFCKLRPKIFFLQKMSTLGIAFFIGRCLAIASNDVARGLSVDSNVLAPLVAGGEQ